jgi:hypothetical protein
MDLTDQEIWHLRKKIAGSVLVMRKKKWVPRWVEITQD